MATFSAQIVSLVGGTPTQSELDVWCIEGAKEIIRQLPVDLQKKCATMQSFTSAAAGSEAETLGEGNVLSAFAGSVNCRLISNTDKYKAEDSGNVLYATSTDPAYYFEADKINVLPTSLSCKYEEIQFPSVDADSDSSISNFPDEAEYLIVLYAATKQLLQYQSSMSSSFNSAITTALDAVTTRLGSANTAYSNMATEIALANQEVDDALTEVAEAISLTDASSSDIKTAVDGMKTAVAKFRADGSDPALFGDESTYDTGGSGMTKVKAALNNAISLIGFGTDGDKYDAGNDLEAVMSDIEAGLNSEDIELAGARMQQAQTQMNAVQSHLSVAQAHIQEWQASVQTLIGEINAFASEASSRYGWINAKAVVWQGELSAAQGYMTTANGFAGQATGFISSAGGYVSEATARLQSDSTKYQWYGDQYTKLSAEYMRGLAALKGT